MNERINERPQPQLRPRSSAPFRSPRHTEGPQAGLPRPFAGACAGGCARPEVAGGLAPRARAPGEGRGRERRGGEGRKEEGAAGRGGAGPDPTLAGRQLAVEPAAVAAGGRPSVCRIGEDEKVAMLLPL